MIPPDIDARRRALTEHDRDMLVEASAGTGKTAVIAGRAALLLASGRPPGSIAAITFAEAAAAELAARIRAFVEALARGDVPRELESALPGGVQECQRANAAEALEGIDGLVATTIHGFCHRIVLAHAVEAGIDPGAIVMDGDEADALFERVLSSWLGRRLSLGTDLAGDDPVAVLALDDPEHAIEVFRSLARFRRANPGARPLGGASRLPGDADALCAAAEEFARWTGDAPAEAATLRISEDLGTLASLCRERAESAIGFRSLWTLSRPPQSRLVDGDGSRLLPWQVGAWVWPRVAPAADANRLGDEAKARYAACEAAYADVAAGIGSALLAALSAELDELLGEYDRAKIEAAALDFDDLLHHADRLLKGGPGVRRAVSDRYRSILVDEAQDTDAFQASMLLSITGLGGPGGSCGRRPGSLFAVGDPKQSIYRFRGADPASYAALRAAIVGANPDGIVHLTANFRSQAGILEHVELCLSKSLEAATSSAYVPLVPIRERASHDGPRVARMDVRSDRGEKVDALRDAEARAVAELCASMIGRRIAVGKDGAVRALRPSDIALLSPTHTGLSRWESALQDAAVPVSPLAGKSLLARQEAFDFLALVRTLADPRDTLAFGSLLRGPLVGLTDSEILAATASLPAGPDGEAGTLSAMIDAGAVGHPVLADLLATLRQLRISGAALSPEALLIEAIERLRVRAALSVRSAGGARAQANLDALVRRARPYAVRGLSAYVAMLQAKWSDVLRSPFRDWPEGRCDDGEDAVTLLTVHNAKGLEWPVVIIVNSASGSRQPEGFLHRRSDGTLHGLMPGLASRGNADARSEEALAEGRERVRLWYVACTRARDLLVLPRLPRVPKKAWAGLVDLRLGELPTLGFDRWPEPVEATRPASNAQSASLFARERERVVASAPAIRWLTPSASDPDRRRYLPSAIPDPDADAPVEIAGAGRSRGNVIHKLIEELLTGELAETEALVRGRASILLGQLSNGSGDAGPDPAECASTALSALAMPAVAMLRGRLVPEWPVHAAMADGSLVTGRVDAMAIGEDGEPEVILDWKSDIDPDAAARSDHVAQMLDYLRATGAARGAIVYVSRSEVGWVERSAAS